MHDIIWLLLLTYIGYYASHGLLLQKLRYSRPRFEPGIAEVRRYLRINAVHVLPLHLRHFFYSSGSHSKFPFHQKKGWPSNFCTFDLPIMSRCSSLLRSARRGRAQYLHTFTNLILYFKYKILICIDFVKLMKWMWIASHGTQTIKIASAWFCSVHDHDDGLIVSYTRCEVCSSQAWCSVGHGSPPHSYPQPECQSPKDHHPPLCGVQGDRPEMARWKLFNTFNSLSRLWSTHSSAQLVLLDS